MPASIKIEQNVTISKDRDSAVQTALSGSTVYSLPNWTSKRNMVDLMLMIMDDEGPAPMYNMRPTKRRRNAADQFYDEQQGEYEARGQPPPDQINRVHTHNNACPKMYDELDKRRSIAQVGMTGFGIHQAALIGTAFSSNQNLTGKFDPSCPVCLKRKKRTEEERKKKKRGLKYGICKRCRNNRNKKDTKNKLGRVTKQKVSKRRTRPTGYRPTTRTIKPSIICSNKCFQCFLTAETKSVSTFKSYENLLSVQEVTLPNRPQSMKIQDYNVKNGLKSKSHLKRKVCKKPASSKSEFNPGNPDTDTGRSVSSYNSYMSTEHEPMVD